MASLAALTRLDGRAQARITLEKLEHCAHVARARGSGHKLIFERSYGTQSQVNQRAWRIFKRTLITYLGAEKFNWICKRYRFDAEKMHREGLPLLPEHIELFSIGAAQHLKSDVERTASSEKRKLDKLSRYEVVRVLNTDSPFRTQHGRHLDPMHIFGSPTKQRAQYIHDPVLMDLEKQRLLADVSQMTYAAWLERLCKSIVSRELIENEIIPAPGLDGRLDFFEVYKEISVGHGLIAYALKPAAQDSSLRPLLVFRSTQMALSRKDVFQSLFQDLESAVGYSGYMATKPVIDRLMVDPHFSKGLIDIAGYSLGATHAQRCLVDWHAKILNACFYSGPGVDNMTADRFAHDLNATAYLRQENLRISYYWVQGDFCPYAGQKHVGVNVNHHRVNIELFKIDRGDVGERALALHGFRYFDNDHASMDLHVERIQEPERLAIELDNMQRDARTLWYENMRQTFGKLVSGFLFSIYLFIRGFENIFGITILRRTEDLS